jgi:hypothetical protein
MGACNQPAGDARNINTWLKVGGFSTSPSSATSVRFLWRRWLTWDGEPNSFAWMLHPYFGRATDGQTTLSDYSPGGDWIPSNTVRPDNPITSGNIGTYMSTAAIGTAYIGDAQVNTLKIAGEGATLVRTYSNSTFYVGSNGGQQVVMKNDFYLPYDAKVVAIWNGRIYYQGAERGMDLNLRYDISGTSVYTGNSLYHTSPLTGMSEVPCIAGSINLPAGWHNIAIQWGSSNNLLLSQQEMTIFVSMR